MKKPLILATGVILGAALSIGGNAFADSSINVSFNPLKIFVNSVDKTPANNQFNNNGSVVPAELIYSGTTYV
ncbi:MAG: superoxide dismutase family protein, partial [Tumebacillaceae bacterium]